MPTEPTPPQTEPVGLPALPPRRRRRRAVRGSHAWCWRKPPSRRRVEVSCARFQPAPAAQPAIAPAAEGQH